MDAIIISVLREILAEVKGLREDVAAATLEQQMITVQDTDSQLLSDDFWNMLATRQKED